YPNTPLWTIRYVRLGSEAAVNAIRVQTQRVPAAGGVRAPLRSRHAPAHVRNDYLADRSQAAQFTTKRRSQTGSVTTQRLMSTLRFLVEASRLFGNSGA